MSADVLLFDAVHGIATSVDSLYRDVRPCRDDLLEFMDANSWFNLNISGRGDHIRIAELSLIDEPLEIWLRAYKRAPKEKVAIMLAAYEDRFPDTCRLFKNFMESKGIEAEARTWKALDYLLSSLQIDITYCSEASLKRLLASVNTMLPKTVAELLGDFLCAENLSNWEYSFHSRRTAPPDNSAYSIQDFSIMAYCVFNEQSWRENALLEKAAASKLYANLWLFCALHFICALRTTDLQRLPVPVLPYPSEELRQHIRSESFSGPDAEALVEQLSFRLRMKPMRPSKTAVYGGVPEIKLFVPQSLKKPLGIIMALALSFREAGDGFVEAVQDLRHLQKFFGSAFAAAAGGRRFSSRRANKAYLQGIETSSQDRPGRAKGYMLAALARSHKGGIGKLPEITDVYLKDAAFSGYKPEFILREMFERGIFGFIPALLLEMYAGEDYRRLDVSGQTALIKCIGLAPAQLENVTGCVEHAVFRAGTLIAEIMKGAEDSGEQLHRVLQNIASGAAPSKQAELLCLRLAAGLRCNAPERSGCIGCGYEIYTKAAFHLLMKEYARLCALKKSFEGTEAQRCKNILEQIVMPAVSEMLESLPLLYPSAELEPLFEIMERGLEDADSNKR